MWSLFDISKHFPLLSNTYTFIINHQLLKIYDLVLTIFLNHLENQSRWKISWRIHHKTWTERIVCFIIKMFTIIFLLQAGAYQSMDLICQSYRNKWLSRKLMTPSCRIVPNHIQNFKQRISKCVNQMNATFWGKVRWVCPKFNALW